MSLFITTPVPCPHCGIETERRIAASLDGPREPLLRKAILDDVFQCFTCPVCENEYVADHPFIYTDFLARHWIAVYPESWESAWRCLEQEATESWRQWLLELAPPSFHLHSDGYLIRAVFGLEALRDKLVCYDAGFDDVVLEGLKLKLMQGGEPLRLSAEERLHLKSVSSSQLTFSLHSEEEDGTAYEARLTVPRILIDRLHDYRDRWTGTLESLSGGPFVDVGRLLIPGDAVPEGALEEDEDELPEPQTTWIN